MGLRGTTVGGLGVALALAVTVVFMIMASQLKSLRLPFIMLFTIPVALVGTWRRCSLSTVLSLFVVPVLYLWLARREGSIEDEAQPIVGLA